MSSCKGKKKKKKTARISASRMMQFVSCAKPFSTEWIYVHLANEYVSLKRESLSLLYSKMFAANRCSLLNNSGKGYGMAKHGLENKITHFRTFPIAVWGKKCPIMSGPDGSCKE